MAVELRIPLSCHRPVPSPWTTQATGAQPPSRSHRRGKTNQLSLSLPSLYSRVSAPGSSQNQVPPLCAAAPGACSEVPSTQIWGEVSLPVCTVHPLRLGRGSLGERGAQTPLAPRQRVRGEATYRVLLADVLLGREGRRRELTRVPGKRNQLVSGSGFSERSGLVWVSVPKGDTWGQFGCVPSHGVFFPP